MLDWATLQQDYGTQEAPYHKAKFGTTAASITPVCQDCGKKCTKARGGFTLTRKTVVCGKCYDEAKHGPTSTVTNYV